VKKIVCVSILFMSLFFIVGCNTIDGVGRDISAAAEWVGGTLGAE